jgi:hypothetical protein
VVCVGVLGCSLTHLCLQKCDPIVNECDSSALHHELASSGARWSSCKLLVLVTLRGCHLLDGLVVVSIEACKKLVRCPREELCKGYCARPMGAAKNNSSKECH